MSKEKAEIKKPPLLFPQTQETILKLEEHLQGDVLVYWVSGNSSIVGEDIVAFFEILKAKKHRKKLFVFLKSNGGNGRASLRIVNLLRQYYEDIEVLVPLNCASAATMLALGANSMQIGPLGYLSAIDTSITHDLSPVDKDNDLVSVSQNELNRVTALWQEQATEKDQNPYHALYQHIHPLVFGAVDRAKTLSVRLTQEILGSHTTDQAYCDKISVQLNSDYPSHAYPITFREAQRIGLPVSAMDPELNETLLGLNNVFSEMAQLALTDYDEFNYHDNLIIKFVETSGMQLYFQKDKDWHYRKEERRWVPMNDESSWRKNEMVKGKMVNTKFFINH
ncbi:MAG: ATP-dependent Clp protease proteolytic subunit [Verrucomicrobiota bacterium]